MKKFILIAVLVIIAAAGGLVYTLSSNGDQVKTALNNMKSAKSYHADVTTGNITFSGDYDFANNNSKGAVTVSGQNVSFVLLGSDSYFSSDGGQSFVKAPGDPSVMQITTLPKDTLTNISNSVNSGGLLLANADPPTDTIGSTTCKHLTAKNSSGTSDVWVASDGSYVCQIKMSGTAGGAGDYTIKITNFNAAVNIAAPANVTSGN